jgi:hypothetical protein
MGAPTFLGGGAFAVDESSVVQQRPGFWQRRTDPAAFAILSVIVTEFRRAGYQTSKVRRGKPDDVRCRCTLSDGGYIEVILVAGSGSGTLRSFWFMAWKFSKTPRPTNEEPSRVWKGLYATIDAVIQKRFDGQPITPLGPSEIDARCGQP